MISNIYWINEDKIGNNKLGMMARPRGNDWLDNEIKSLKKREVDCFVSLLEKSEQWELELQEEKEICKKWEIEFINFPIKDVNTPDNEKEFMLLADNLTNKISQNKKIVIHCRMGIGRTSILIAAIMIKLGYKGTGIFELIGEYRKLKVPDTKEQKDWLLSIENKLQLKK